MKRVKNLLSLVLAFALALSCGAPAFAEEETLSESVSSVWVATDWASVLSVGDLPSAVEGLLLLLPAPLREKLDLSSIKQTLDLSSILLAAEGTPFGDLVGTLFASLLGNAAGDSAPENISGTHPAFLREGQPYVVTQTVRYRDENGTLEYALTLRGTFINVGGKPVCLKTGTDVETPFPKRWRVEAGTPVSGDGEAYCDFTASRLFTGVAVSKTAVRLTVKGLRDYDPATGRRYGDADRDGRITAADARLALRTAVELVAPDAETKNLADRDRDGRVTAADARSILRLAVGLDE